MGFSLEIGKKHVVVGAGVMAAALFALLVVRMWPSRSIAAGGDVAPAEVESSPFDSTHLGVSLALPSAWQHERTEDRDDSSADGVSSRTSKFTRNDSVFVIYLTLVSPSPGSRWETSERPTSGELLAAANKVRLHQMAVLSRYNLAYSCVGTEVVTFRGLSVARCQGQLTGSNIVFHTSYFLARPERIASVVLAGSEQASSEVRRELEALVASIEL